MGAIRRSKAHALVVQDDRKKKKQKSRDLDHIYEQSIESSKETLNPNGGKYKKERTKCIYYNRGFHPKTYCMVKTIDLMAKVLQQHNLADCILDSTNKKIEDKPLEDQVKGHVLTIISS